MPPQSPGNDLFGADAFAPSTQNESLPVNQNSSIPADLFNTTSTSVIPGLGMTVDLIYFLLFRFDYLFWI